MAERTWFYAADGKQQGPVADAQLRDLIGRGTVRADTLVWSDGMSGWQAAGQVPGLMPAGSAPPPAMMSGGVAAGDGQITTDFGTFGFLGRVLLSFIGMVLVIPAPWTMTMLYSWVIERIRVPGRPNLTFTGKPFDIWYVFIIQGLGLYVYFYAINYVPLLAILLILLLTFLGWMVVRWVVANISADGQPLGLSFQGSPWAYIGWFVFYMVSIITIIGWAWVMTAWLRWMARNIGGTRRAVVFNGSGWGVLWRTLVFSLVCGFIIPIPWILAWYVRWYVSQFAVVERTA
jgi:hypothetical protein